MQSCLASIPDECECVYLAYSGGLDSSVLLHLLVNSQRSWRIVPWHINHGLIATAGAMEQFCVEQARRYHLELRIDRLDLGPNGCNLEALAREQRYRLFAGVNQANHCVLTAHHADDQAETFLLNALRSSGSAGLRGIASRRKLGEGWLLRPLLDYSRAQLEAYAQQHELAWFNDPSNRDLRFDRNYLRHEVMPRLAQRWPNFQLSLAGASRLQQETQQMLDELAQLDLQSVSSAPSAGQPTLDLQSLRALSAARARNLLRYWINQAGLASMPAARLHELLNQLDARSDAMPQIAMPDYSVRLYDGRLFLVPRQVLTGCQGVYEFGRQGRIELDDCHIDLSRAQLFERLQREDRNQRVTLRFRGTGQLSADRHRLKRLYQKLRIPPWQRQATAQVYLDDELAGLLT